MKHLSAILALAILLTVGLACSDSGETAATTSDNTTTVMKPESESGAVAVKSVILKNADDETVTSFKPSDLTHKASIEFSKMGAGKVRGVFTAVNAGGEKNVKILEKEIELTSQMNTANFTMKLDQPFPAGDYKLDVYLNDKLVKTHNYKVQ
jgi:hypothetical protein